MRLGQEVIWYTFLLVLGYLLLTRWKGANALLGTVFSGYRGSVKVLQGRG